jgi:teichuronic acid biosynthesis glycosyltransferase TuaG
MSGKVSIIMPAYNAARYLADTINSVLRQTHTDWELLVVDDGSTDGTAAVVRQFTDGRIRYFYQPNAGVSAARNKGLQEMTGDFFCFLDSDDLFPLRSLESRLQVFAQDPGIAFVDGVVEVKNESLDRLLRLYKPQFKGSPLQKLIRLSADCFLGNTWMIRRQPGLAYGFQKGVTHGEDRLFYIHIADQGLFSFTDEVVLVYRRREGSAMSNLDGLQKGYEHLYRTVKKGVKSRTTGDLLYLKYKICRIMFLSNLSARRYPQAFSTLVSNLVL